ncbi:MAG: 16S rRNA (cytosine(1402)-N(4))-methyltransferase RsmH [Candidatus Omnitrophica bacterium]|nr:16S rRNA (cytosine(1402)-N(4))-methyltransferase RsmH [Candidatus Omnitrophota bacterium]
MENITHIPVMLKEVLHYLNLSAGKIIVDATVGVGGHSLAIIEKILPNGRLICIDRDEESLSVAQTRLSGFSGSCEFVHGNFMDISTILNQMNIRKIDGILFDLGVSRFQLENPQRGFSFQTEGPLDMRMDRTSYISAYDLVNNLNQEELSALLWNFGQERWHNRIASFLVKERQSHPITTTLELSDIVFKAIPPRYKNRYYRIHPATKTFQAMRIAVNRELEALQIALKDVIDYLNPNARICVISFHSLEDRIVKFSFRESCSKGKLKIITPKPIVCMRSEIKINPSSRSAKLRVAERI